MLSAVELNRLRNLLSGVHHDLKLGFVCLNQPLTQPLGTLYNVSLKAAGQVLGCLEGVHCSTL